MKAERDRDLPREISDPILREVVSRLVPIYHPERIYLFGSAARGETGPDSDYDIVVIVPDQTPPELRRSARAYEALWGLKAAVDVLVWTRGAFERRLHLVASLPAAVAREGRLLYGA